MQHSIRRAQGIFARDFSNVLLAFNPWAFEVAISTSIRSYSILNRGKDIVTNPYAKHGFRLLKTGDDITNQTGIYIFKDISKSGKGLPYVGMSTVNVAGRIASHAKNLRLNGSSAIYFKPISQSSTNFKLQLETAETIIINKLRGKAMTANKVLPVSKARNSKLNFGITNYVN